LPAVNAAIGRQSQAFLIAQGTRILGEIDAELAGLIAGATALERAVGLVVGLLLVAIHLQFLGENDPLGGVLLVRNPALRFLDFPFVHEAAITGQRAGVALGLLAGKEVHGHR